jgi:hypothetical protein
MKEIQFSHREGDYLIFQDESGQQLRTALSGNIRQAIRNQDTQAAGFSPGEVQSLIRTGLSLAEVSAKLNATEDAIEPFAAPVIAELNYVKSSALAVLVVAQDYDHTIPLSDLLQHKMGEHEIKVSKDGRDWIISAAGERGTASFTFDPKNGWLKPTNELAREIFEEQSTPAPFSVIESTPEIEPDATESADASSVATDLLEELQRRRAQKQSEPEMPKPDSSSKRPSLPSWDEIVFGAGEGKTDKEEED